MRIGFDVSQTGTEKAGCGHVAHSLVRKLAEIDRENEYLLYPTFGDRYRDPQGSGAAVRVERPNFEVWSAPEPLDEAEAFWRRPAPDFEARLGHPDIVHSHNFFCPQGLERARLVYTLYDLAFLSHPQWTTEHNRLLCFEGVFAASLYADLVLAISRHSRDHFLATFPHYPAERVRVLPLASRFRDASPVARPASLPEHLGPDGYLLFVGTLEPRKNPWRLLRAYAGYVERVPDPLPLAVAGGPGWLVGDFDERAAALGLGDRLIRLGYVDEPALLWLYQNCRAFLYPSLFEGFGLPVLEAMSQGAAVVTSNASSLPEVVGEAGAALLVDPHDSRQLEDAMVRVAGDPALRGRLRSAGKARASRFSWRSTAEQVLASYREVLTMAKYAG